jgi:hypothetical protein
MPGIFGVPTNLDAAGAPTAASANPPGWFVMSGTASSNDDGDTVHQLRLFIEVTGTTLDIMVFDPGNSGARDLERGGSTTTTFQLRNPSGTVMSAVNNFGNDNATTNNRLVRFTPNNQGFYALNSASANNVSFSGLNPGLYEFRITMTGGDDDVNAFGVDIRVAKGDSTHYSAYTIGDSTNPDTAFICGTVNSGGVPYANITQRMFFYPYVTRGCTLQTSNFDMDTGAGNPGANSVGEITDVLGSVRALTMSGGTVHSENTIVVHDTTATLLESLNYGMYFLTSNTGTQQNLIDWRVADFSGWNNNPGNLPRDPTNPIRMYLPNGYVPPVPPATNATAPAEPILALSARVVGGTNPPVAGQTTRLDVTASVDNPTGLAISSVQITVGLPVNVTFVAGTQVGTIDGSPAACTDGSGAGYRRCTFAALGAGSVASLSFEVDFAPPAAGLRNLTGPPAAGSPPPNTTTWAQYTPAFSSAAFPRTETLGPVCNLVVNVGAAGALPTRATIRGLRVNPDSVEFATGTQHDTLAFNLYSVADGKGRSRRARLNQTPIPAPMPTSLTPILYRGDTGPIDSPFLVIEEIDTRGRHRLMGPFSVSDQRLREMFERIEQRLHQAGTGERRQARMVPPARQARLRQASARHWHGFGPRERAHDGIAIEVRQAGRVRVPFLELHAHGLPEWSRKLAARLALTNQGQPVEFSLEPGASGAPGAIRFEAARLSTAYTGGNVYVLSWGHAVPNAPQVPLTRTDDPLSPGTIRVEENWIYVPNAPQGSDPWLWELLFADEPAPPFPFDLPALAPGAAGDVPVRIRLLARSTHRHTVEAFVNGRLTGSVAFRGAGPALLAGSLPAEVLSSAGNQLELRYTAEDATADDPGMVYLNYLDLSIPPTAPVKARPDSLRPFDPSLPRLEGIEYLVITHAAFREQAEEIASLKRRDGLQAVVVDVERAYDRYSAGIVEAAAIRALIREAATAGPLRFVLLVGDDTFDPRDFLGTGTIAFVPSLFAWDGEFGRIPSENRYADLDDDGMPDLAIGRLPVQTPQEAAILVDKIARQASILQAAQGRHLFAVDNQAPGDVSFQSQAQSVAGGLPAGSQTVWADIGSGGAERARAILRQSLALGPLATHYFGHAGPETWADEGLLTTEDLAELGGTYRETVVFTWACESQYYLGPFAPTLSEGLLLVPAGGALASFGPAGITAPVLQQELFSRMYPAFLDQGLPLGEAIRQAKSAALGANVATRPVVEGWNLLGDPALQVPR